MDLVELGIQNAQDLHLLAFETVHQIRTIEAIDVLPRRKDKIAAEMLDAIHSAGVGGTSHGLGLEHFLMRASQRVNVEGALAVGDFTAKAFRGCTLAVH